LRRKPASEQRGMTVPEVLTATIVAAIVMTFAVSLFEPAVTIAGDEQAQTSLVQSTDGALYRIQRDIRQSDPNGIFVCSGAPPPSSCTLASSLATPTQTQYMAILTAHTDGDGAMNWDESGRPAWTGFQIYWLDPDVADGGNTLEYGFAPATIQPGTDPVILNADVVQAVDGAITSSSAAAVARSIQDIQTSVDVARDSVAVRIGSTSSGGSAAGSTLVQSDTYARN
jgi:prepilin-type N-terminal cleavage/methylation domain-containing protein